MPSQSHRAKLEYVSRPSTSCGVQIVAKLPDIVAATRVQSHVSLDTCTVKIDSGPNASWMPLVHVAWFDANATEPSSIEEFLELGTCVTFLPHLDSGLTSAQYPRPTGWSEIGVSIKPSLSWDAAPKVIWWVECRTIAGLTPETDSHACRIYLDYTLNFDLPNVARPPAPPPKEVASAPPKPITPSSSKSSA